MLSFVIPEHESDQAIVVVCWSFVSECSMFAFLPLGISIQHLSNALAPQGAGLWKKWLRLRAWCDAHSILFREVQSCLYFFTPLVNNFPE